VKEKIKNSVVVFLALVIIFTGVFNHLSGIFAIENDKIKPTVIIDAGHGGLTNTID